MVLAKMVLEWGNLALNGLENVAVGVFFSGRGLQGRVWHYIMVHERGNLWHLGLGMVKICWIMVCLVVSRVRLLYTGGSQLLIYEG